MITSCQLTSDREMLVSVGYRAGSVEQKDWNFFPPFPPPPPPTTSCESDWLMGEIKSWRKQVFSTPVENEKLQNLMVV